MLKIIYRLSLLASVVGLFSATTVLPVSAQSADERDSITISPSIVRISADAGDTSEAEMTVVNDGNMSYAFRLYAQPYWVSGESYEPNYTNPPSNANAHEWVQLKRTEWHIKPGKTLKVPYTIVIPKDASPGSHYGVIFAETQPESAQMTSVIRKKRVGMLVYAKVNGNFISDGEVIETKISPLQLHPPIAAWTRIKNSGNADFDVEVNMRVADIFGNKKYDKTQNYTVLPDTIRKIALNWDDSPSIGLYKVDLTTKFLDKTNETSSYVLMIPGWLLISTAVGIFVWIAYSIIQRRRRW